MQCYITLSKKLCNNLLYIANEGMLVRNYFFKVQILHASFLAKG